MTDFGGCAIELLEMSGEPDARAVLEALAQAPPEPD